MGKASADLRHKFKPFSECHMKLTQPQIPGKKSFGSNDMWTECLPHPPLHAPCYIKHFLISLLTKRKNHLKKRQFAFSICEQNYCQSSHQLAIYYVVVLPNNN